MKTPKVILHINTLIGELHIDGCKNCQKAKTKDELKKMVEEVLIRVINGAELITKQ